MGEDPNAVQTKQVVEAKGETRLPSSNPTDLTSFCADLAAQLHRLRGQDSGIAGRVRRTMAFDERIKSVTRRKILGYMGMQPAETPAPQSFEPIEVTLNHVFSSTKAFRWLLQLVDTRCVAVPG